MADSFMRAGLHLHGTEFDLEAALALGPRSYTLLDLDRELVGPILRRYPDARAHIRQWAHVTEPAARAREAAAYALELARAFPDAEIWHSSANEPDLESFGGQMSAERFRTWAEYAAGWAREMRALFRDAGKGDRLRLLYCAPSPGHQEDGPEPPIGYQVMADAIRLYDGLAVHLYLDPEEQDAELQQWRRYRIFRPAGHKHPQDPGGLYSMGLDPAGPLHKPIWITECNATDAARPGVPARAREFLRRVAELDVQRRILGVDWFLWDSPDPHFASMRLAVAPALWAVWRDTPWPAGPSPEGPAPPGGAGWDDVWLNYQHRLDAYPALAKAAAREALGAAITGEYDVAIRGTTFRVQECAGGLVYAPVGEWTDVRVARSRGDLPR